MVPQGASCGGSAAAALLGEMQAITETVGLIRDRAEVDLGGLLVGVRAARPHGNVVPLTPGRGRTPQKSPGVRDGLRGRWSTA